MNEEHELSPPITLSEDLMLHLFSEYHYFGVLIESLLFAFVVEPAPNRVPSRDTRSDDASSTDMAQQILSSTTLNNVVPKATSRAKSICAKIIYQSQLVLRSNVRWAPQAGQPTSRIRFCCGTVVRIIGSSISRYL